MQQPVFQEQVLNASDVCNNCFGLIREEREQIPPEKQRQNRTYPATQLARNPRTTTVEYVPDGKPTRSHAVFCECGCSSAYDRYRSEIVPRTEFRSLLKTAIQTVESKGVTLSRRHAVRRAIKLGLTTNTAFPVYSADRAIAEGIKHGVEMISARSDSSSPVTASE